MKIYDEFHLYSNKIESFIKIPFWGVLWIYGVYSIFKNLKNNITENATIIATAFFMFSLSLAMEFFKTIIKQKKKKSSIIYQRTFFLVIVVSFVLSSLVPLTNMKNPMVIKTLFFLSIGAMVFLAVDFLLSLFFDTTKTEIEKDQIRATEKMRIKSRSGSLGNINRENSYE